MQSCHVQNNLNTELPFHRHGDARIIIVLKGEVHETDLAGSRIHHAGEIFFRPPFCSHANASSDSSSSFLRLVVSRHSWTKFTLKYGWRVMHGRVNLEERAQRELLGRRENGDGFLSMLADQNTDKLTPHPPIEKDEIADRVGHCQSFNRLALAEKIKPHQLTRRFIRKFGCTPTAYRREFRLRRAYALLGASELSLGEVAAECGFSDQSHLSREVKMMTGHTPGGFRAFVSR